MPGTWLPLNAPCTFHAFPAAKSLHCGDLVTCSQLSLSLLRELLPAFLICPGSVRHRQLFSRQGINSFPSSSAASALQEGDGSPTIRLGRGDVLGGFLGVCVCRYIRSAVRRLVCLNFPSLLTLGEWGRHPHWLPSHHQSSKLKASASSCQVRSHLRYPLGKTRQQKEVG